MKKIVVESRNGETLFDIILFCSSIIYNKTNQTVYTAKTHASFNSE